MLFLLALVIRPANALGYLDYNATSGLEVNTNQRLIPGNERVASGYRFSSAPVLGYEAETRAWSIAPTFNFQRFGNDVRGDQEFFNLATQGRYDWTQRFSTSLNGRYQFDNNQQVNVEDPDPTIVFTQVALERQSRSLNGTASYRWSERVSTSITGTYSDLLIADVPGATATQPSFDSKSVSMSGSYAWNERLSFNGNIGLSQFKTFDGNRRNNDRFFSGGLSYAISEKWQFSGSAGLRSTDQTSRVFLPGNIIPGAIVSNLPIRPELEGTFSPELDALFGVPVIIVGGRARLRLQEAIPGFQTERTVSNTYDFQVSRSYSRGTISIGLSRAIQPAGIQAQTDLRNLQGNLSYRFNDRLNGNLNYIDSSRVIQGQEFGDNAFSSQSVVARLSYSLTRQFALNGSYAFRRNSAPAFGLAEATGHVVSVGLSYNGDRLEW